MIPNVTRGARPGGLLAYLTGPGRANEHAEPHLVAGSGHVMAWFGGDVLDAAAAQEVARELDASRLHHGVEVFRSARVTDPDTGAVMRVKMPASVWHCSLSLAATEGQLSDEQWAAIAGDLVAGMGFEAGPGQPAACTWAAVRHGLSKNGNDHVHVAVSLVRSDGSTADTWRDFARAQEQCRELEQRYGLAALSSREYQLGDRGVHPAETARAAREGAVEVLRHRLERAVRASAGAALDEGEFVRRMRQAGVLVRPRYATGRDDVVAGYSVAVRPVERGQRPVWYGGGRLAKDLTLPRLREGWPDAADTATAAVAEWQATGRNPFTYRPVTPGRETATPAPELWRQYAGEMREVRARLASVPASDRSAWAHVARDTAGVFAAWSQRVEDSPGPLAAVAAELRRSAQLPAHLSTRRPVAWAPAAGVTALMLQSASRGNPSVAEAVLYRQLARTSLTLIQMHSALGDARRANSMLAAVTSQLQQIGDRMPAVPVKRPDGSTATAAGPDAELEQALRIAGAGQRPATEALRSPLPPTPPAPGRPGVAAQDPTTAHRRTR